jgi:aspartokinase-like uncharacterized kinase
VKPVVVKVGGSLFGWAELKLRLRGFIDSLAGPVLVVPGGGAAANAIREFDRLHALGEEASHWLALRACTMNGHMLSTLLGKCPMVADVTSPDAVAVVDLLGFAERDEIRADHLPHHWNVTSDSMALRVAIIAEARELKLLKSTAVDGNWSHAAERGQVDAFFPTALSGAPSLKVSAVNLRATTL